MTWHRPEFLRNVGFLKGLVHSPRTQEQRQADERAETSRHDTGGLASRARPTTAPSSADLPPRSSLPGARAASSSSVQSLTPTQATLTVAQLTAGTSRPAPGLRAFLDRPYAQTALSTGIAVDLGAGGGRDTRALINAGWPNVHAVDKDPHTVDALRDVTEGQSATVHTSTLHDADIPPGSADIVNAQRVLPFLGEDLTMTLGRARDLLRPGGFLVASFFGPQHTWAEEKPRLAFHDVATVQRMLEEAGFEVIDVDDAREPNHVAANGATVPIWHEVRVNAQRK